MSKKPSKTKKQHKQDASHRPDPAEIKAVERLLGNQAYAKAIGRIRSLLRRFPEHGGLYRLLVQALHQHEGVAAAALAAIDWSRLRPNSLPAHETLLEHYVQLGAPLLADQAAVRVRELGGKTPGFPLETCQLNDYLAEPNGSVVTREAMLVSELGLLWMQAGDMAGALPFLEDGETVAARIAHGLALFHLGRINEAAARFDALQTEDPGNLQAGGWRIRLRLYRGDVGDARAIAARLSAARARRIEDAVVQIESLLLIGEDSAAMRCYDRFVENNDLALADQETRAQLLHLAACAAARSGNGARAEAMWQDAVQLDAQSTVVRANLETIANTGQFPRFPTIHSDQEAFPAGWMRSLRDSATDDPTGFRSLGASNAYLDAIYRCGTHAQRLLVLSALEERIEIGDAEAGETLRGFALLDIGQPDERFDMLYLLQDLGRIDQGESVSVWDGRQIRDVKLIGTRILRDPRPHDLAKDLVALLDAALQHHGKGEFPEARTTLEAILEREPDHPVVLGHLANVLAADGQVDDARAVWQRILDRHPDDLSTRCSLAVERILGGDLEGADDLLEGLAQRVELHIQDAFSLFGTIAMLHRARAENDAADQMLSHLDGLVESTDDTRLLQEAKLLQSLAVGS